LAKVLRTPHNTCKRVLLQTPFKYIIIKPPVARNSYEHTFGSHKDACACLSDNNITKTSCVFVTNVLFYSSTRVDRRDLAGISTPSRSAIFHQKAMHRPAVVITARYTAASHVPRYLNGINTQDKCGVMILL